MRRRLTALLIALDAFFRGVKWYTVVPVARLIGRLRARRQIISSWPETPANLGPNIVLFMHFDRYGNVRQQLFDYMKQFAANGRSVVFVTNSGKLSTRARARLQEFCAAIIVRENVGYDFGAWCDAIEFLDLPRSDTRELILANDSVFGPLTPLSDMLQRLDYETADIWGLTESWQYRYHLQSFFMAFGPAALSAEIFRDFWSRVRPVPSKAFIIRAYEIGVTQVMIKAGLRCAALWPYEQLIRAVDGEALEKLVEREENDFGKTDPIHITRKLQVMRVRDAMARRIALNPTADLWRQLLMTGFPFIKRELLRDNPAKVEDVGDWIEVARAQAGGEPALILQDLRLMLKDQAP